MLKEILTNIIMTIVTTAYITMLICAPILDLDRNSERNEENQKCG